MVDNSDTNLNFEDMPSNVDSSVFDNFDILKNSKPISKKLKRPPHIRIVIFVIMFLLLASAIIGFLLFYYGFNRPYVKVLKTAITSVVKYDWEEYSSILSDELKKNIGSSLGSPGKESTERFMGLLHNFYFSSFGNNLTVEMNKISSQKMSIEKTKEIQDIYNNTYHSSVEFEQLYRVDSILVITGDDKSKETKIEVFIPKINNRWVLITPEFLY